MADRTKPSTQAIKLLAQARMHVTLNELDQAATKIDQAVEKIKASDAREEVVQAGYREEFGLQPRRSRKR